MSRRTGVPAPSPRRGHTPITLFLPLVLPFAVLAGVAVFAALTPYDRSVTASPGRPGALVWGDGIFANRCELKAWLKQHGVSYSVWVHQHPAAVHLVTHQSQKHRLRRRALPVSGVLGANSPPHAIKPRLATAKSGKSPSSPSGTAGLTMRFPFGAEYLLAILSFLGLSGALVPRALLDRFALSPRIAELRLPMAVVGLAILCGMALALLS